LGLSTSRSTPATPLPSRRGVTRLPPSQHAPALARTSCAAHLPLSASHAATRPPPLPPHNAARWRGVVGAAPRPRRPLPRCCGGGTVSARLIPCSGRALRAVCTLGLCAEGVALHADRPSNPRLSAPFDCTRRRYVREAPSRPAAGAAGALGSSSPVPSPSSRGRVRVTVHTCARAGPFGMMGPAPVLRFRSRARSEARPPRQGLGQGRNGRAGPPSCREAVGCPAWEAERFCGKAQLWPLTASETAAGQRGAAGSNGNNGNSAVQPRRQRQRVRPAC
jgi:hypothetical protein